MGSKWGDMGSKKAAHEVSGLFALGEFLLSAFLMWFFCDHCESDVDPASYKREDVPNDDWDRMHLYVFKKYVQ